MCCDDHLLGSVKIGRDINNVVGKDSGLFAASEGINVHLQTTFMPVPVVNPVVIPVFGSAAVVKRRVMESGGFVQFVRIIIATVASHSQHWMRS